MTHLPPAPPSPKVTVDVADYATVCNITAYRETSEAEANATNNAPRNFPKEVDIIDTSYRSYGPVHETLLHDTAKQPWETLGVFDGKEVS